jgi:general secretion pathway protein C
MILERVLWLGFNDNRAMLSTFQRVWLPRLAALILAALAAASATFWALKLHGSASDVGLPAVPATEVAASDPMAVARALGGGKTAVVAQAAALPSVASRLALVGVVANPKSGGAALISVDGKPAKPFAVGSVVEDGLVLKSVGTRQAALAQGAAAPASVTLEMPPLKR